ncbi:unnamed protein product, partial [Cyprideis torosa]
MIHNDRISLALLLTRIRLRGLISERTHHDVEWSHFLRGKEALLSPSAAEPLPGLNPLQSEAVKVLAKKFPAFSKMPSQLGSAEVKEWMASAAPEASIPAESLWTEQQPLSPFGKSLHGLLVIQALRPDRVVSMSHRLVNAVLGEEFMTEAEREVDLADVVENQVQSRTPILLCSVPGFDASGRVDDLAAQLNQQITAIAIGSAEGFTQADKAINSSVRTGRWVLLKNVHLAPAWLVQLEKKLHSLSPHAAFRLFLTMEISPKLPVNLLRAGRIFVFEPPPGIRANLLRTFSTVPASRMMRAPGERARLYFLLAWFHAIVQERLRYAPLGWSKKYEFTESDLKVACDTLDTWVDMTALVSRKI